MDKKNNNAMVPRLRFPGFTDAWEQRKISQLANLNYGGGTPPTIKEEYWHGVIPWIQSSDITKDDVLNVSPKKFISQDAVNHSATKIVPANSIAVITRVGVGKLAFMPFSYTTSQDFLSLSKLNVDGHFAVYSLYRKLQNDLNIVQGTSIKGITKGELLAKEIAIPEIREQNQIGAFFKDLNNLITLHQRKLNHLKDRKKALLQQLFPKNGESVPRLRFPGFTDAWEQRKLGELASVSMNRRVFKEQTNESGDVPFFKIGTFGSTPDAFISRELFEQYKGKYPYPKVGDILISASGSIGRTVEYTGKDEYFQDSNIVWLSHDGRIDNTFLKCFYDVVKWAGIEGSTIKRLYNDNILNTEIRLPSVDEQRQIGTYFKNLDNLITLHQRKLNHLKDRKKALLQQLFI